jgi:hypothetical protein
MRTVTLVDEFCQLARVLVTILGSMVLGLPGTALGADEACRVEGVTTLWAMSYCMTRYETDDEAHPDVSRCFLKELQQKLSEGPEEDCAANIAYKSAICSLLIEWQLYEESLMICVDSDETIPSVVTNGIE